MHKDYEAARQERIRKVMEEHAQRNRGSLPIGWTIRGKGIAGVVLLVITVAFALSDQGTLFLSQLSDRMFDSVDSGQIFEPEQTEGDDADITSPDSMANVSGDSERNGADTGEVGEDVLLIRDRLVALVHRKPNGEIGATAKAEARALVRLLPVSDDRKRRLNRVIDKAAADSEQSPASEEVGLMRLSGGESINSIGDTLMVVDGGLSINRISNSLAIVDGSVKINHSANNIIISSGDVQINADGDLGGSVVMAKGMVRINSAAYTIISAEDGVRINASRDVRKFGPGFFDNLISMVEKLFQ